MSGKQLIIFDTTLRDGEQAPGHALFYDEKIEIAYALERLGVDIIEAGFPVSGISEYKAVQQISSNIRDSIICGFSRAVESDIDLTANSLTSAFNRGNGRLHIFMPVSDLHLEAKFGINRDEALARIKSAVSYTRNYTDNVQIGFEDATRANLDFLCQATEVAIHAGAATVGYGDTVGYATPTDITNLITTIKNNVSNIGNTNIGIHCHNDLGLATANSLAAIQAGANQVDVTINQIGERAGNASIEEVVMATQVRPDIYPYTTNIDTTQFTRTSQQLAEMLNTPVPVNKPIVGKNVFGHTSGIHQSGMIRDTKTYQIMKPEDVGQTHTRMTFSKHSGQAGLRYILQNEGVSSEINDGTLESIYKEAMDLTQSLRTVPNQLLIDLARKHIKPTFPAQ